MDHFRVRNMKLNEKLRLVKKWRNMYRWHSGPVCVWMWRTLCTLSQHGSSEPLPTLWSASGSLSSEVSSSSRGCSRSSLSLRFCLFKNFSPSLDVSRGLILKFYTCQGLPFQLGWVWKAWVRQKRALNTGRWRLGTWRLFKCLMKHRIFFCLPMLCMGQKSYRDCAFSEQRTKYVFGFFPEVNSVLK